jgi:hypothetical protein
MKEIKGINIHNLEVVIKGHLNRHDIDLGALTLSVDGREFILDVVQSYSDETEDNDGNPILRISCDLEPDEDTFDECPYDLTKDDLLDAEHNDLVRTLYVGGEIDFEVESILLHFDDCEGQDYQLEIDED